MTTTRVLSTACACARTRTHTHTRRGGWGVQETDFCRLKAYTEEVFTERRRDEDEERQRRNNEPALVILLIPSHHSISTTFSTLALRTSPQSPVSCGEKSNMRSLRICGSRELCLTLMQDIFQYLSASTSRHNTLTLLQANPVRFK